jgi:multidrug resistance efflux pump
LWIAVAVVLGCAVLLFGWVASRLSRSETEDAFIEAHIVNVAPEAVSGHILRFLVEENDRVKQ